ncbi:MAG TPA: DUF1549 domain-containing protein, partial [Pirellulaceae bacterium]|nr:DUF1549 domain-containing protein [Pirellulaceae bacterium]
MSLRFPGIDSPKLARLPAFAALLGLAMFSGVCDCVVSAADSSQLKTSTDAGAKPTPVYFGTDVVPTLTRLGCNTGGCHGKASGQNGFRLSLLGFEPDVDYASLVSEARGRRLFPAAPERSLLLQKATSRLPHGGGRRLDEESDDYRLLRDWIAAGAPPPRATDPRLVRIEVTPGAGTMVPGGSQQLKVTAVLSDGTTRDVTKRSVYQSNEPNVLSVDDGGLVKTDTRQGLASVMARFGDQIATFHAAVPFGGGPNDPSAAQRRSLVTQQLDALQTQINANNAATPDAANNATRSSTVSPSSTAPRAAIAAVDRLLVRQWRRMNVAPSPVVDDAKFLRRASLDICGTLPTPAEIDEYVADARPDKRERMIDRLLERPEYASYFGLKWADILQNRGAGYSTSKQRAGTTLFAQWIRDSIATNKPYDQFVAEILTASGSQ